MQAYQRSVAVIYAPRMGAEEKDWPQYSNYLIARAQLLRLNFESFNLSGMMHDLRYFSTEEYEQLFKITDLIRTDSCCYVWFAGNGVSEAVRILMYTSYIYRKARSYVGLRRAKEVSQLLDWYRLGEKENNLPVRYRA